MSDDSNKEVAPEETPKRSRRIGIQAPLYKNTPGKPTAQLSPDEYHEAVERHRNFQESLKRKWMTPKNALVGGVILAFDLTVLQWLPFIVKTIGLHDPVLLGKWLIGLVGVITVATFVYIFTSE